MKNNRLLLVAILAILTGIPASHKLIAQSQNVTPEVFDTASMEGQLEYMEQRTRIYNGFRAIREDMFQKLQRNVRDSIIQATAEIGQLNQEITRRDSRIGTLQTELEKIKEERDQAIRTKESFALLGMEINKRIYNTILWLIILGLAAASILMFLLFKRSNAVTARLKSELEKTREEFETYRTTAREKQEKMVVAHHNEMMKLRKG